ncbi:uncharacterized protein LOC134342964 [Mobula hypostoma]|uniref:uncharacterized protein LOC134342964 n=1 Tax=Mobula hypostoma TaxID=723540 RepID=UPI002FC3A93F
MPVQGAEVGTGEKVSYTDSGGYTRCQCKVQRWVQGRKFHTQTVVGIQDASARCRGGYRGESFIHRQWWVYKMPVQGAEVGTGEKVSYTDSGGYTRCQCKVQRWVQGRKFHTQTVVGIQDASARCRGGYRGESFIHRQWWVYKMPVQGAEVGTGEKVSYTDSGGYTRCQCKVQRWVQGRKFHTQTVVGIQDASARCRGGYRGESFIHRQWWVYKMPVQGAEVGTGEKVSYTDSGGYTRCQCKVQRWVQGRKFHTQTVVGIQDASARCRGGYRGESFIHRQWWVYKMPVQGAEVGTGEKVSYTDSGGYTRCQCKV